MSTYFLNTKCLKFWFVKVGNFFCLPCTMSRVIRYILKSYMYYPITVKVFPWSTVPYSLRETVPGRLDQPDALLVNLADQEGG